MPFFGPHGARAREPGAHGTVTRGAPGLKGRGPKGTQGIPWEGVPDSPWEGNPWEPKGSHGRGLLGPPVGCFCLFEVAFLEDPSETKIQNHSHEIRLEKLVCMLFLRHNFAFTWYHNIEKPLKKTISGPIWPGHRPEFTRNHDLPSPMGPEKNMGPKKQP